MNITFICNEYPPRPQGGIGTFIYHFARGLRNLGHNVTVAGIWTHNTEVDDNGIRVVTRASSAGEDYFGDRRRFYDWLTADVKANRTDLVEVPEFDGMLPFRFQGCPVAVRLHQSYSGIALSRLRPPRPAVYWCERQTLQHHPDWIAVSRAVLQYTRRVFLLRPRTADVVYNFAPAASTCRPEALTAIRARFGDFVLYVGKLTEAKGAFDLARAASLFLSRHPFLSLVYVGKDLARRGKLASHTIRNLLGPELSGRVHFAGVRPHAEVATWMAAARVYVQPSHLEAFSMTPLEAMQSGVPVVYTRRASGPEVINDTRTGLLVEPSRPGEIAAAVDRIYSDSAYAQKMVTSALADVRNRFSLDRCIRKSMSAWARCCSVSARGHCTAAAVRLDANR